MTDMRQILENYLENSSPEQLQAELQKGNRPFLQTLVDAVLICQGAKVDAAKALPQSIQAGVSFFQGIYTAQAAQREWHGASPEVMAASQELALAA